MEHERPPPIRTFTQEQVTNALDSASIPYQIAGRQVNADLAGAGHFHLKITHSRGLYLDAATGKGGTIASFLYRLHLTPITPPPICRGECPCRWSEAGKEYIFFTKAVVFKLDLYHCAGHARRVG